MSITPLLDHHDLRQRLGRSGYAVVKADEIGHLSDDRWRTMATAWDALETDMHLAGRGFCRERRYARFTLRRGRDGYVVSDVRCEDFVQNTAQNKLYDGVTRRFAPCRAWFLDHPDFRRLLELDASIVGSGVAGWDVGVHQIRVRWRSDTGLARPTPEGRHQDGHQYIAMHLIGVSPSSGGVSRLFDSADHPEPVFTMRLRRRGDTLILNDQRMFHEVTPIHPLDAEGQRDMLIIDFRQPLPTDARPGAGGGWA